MPETNRSGAAQPSLGGSQPHVVVFDGGSKGNPGPGYGSYRITRPDGTSTTKRLTFDDIGVMTNNQAEYMTLIEALEHLTEEMGSRRAFESVRIEGDSQLVLNQLRGTWKVKNQGLKPLYQWAKSLADQFASVNYVWHSRDKTVAILGH